MTTRRAFNRGLALLLPCLASGIVQAQPSTASRRIGVLFVLLSPKAKEAEAFRTALASAGYVEGRDMQIEWRSANGDYGRLPQLARELVERGVEVIVADTTPATSAARRATSKIPIVMAIVADPVGSGLISSLSKPGENITGLSIMLAELSGKRLQLLKEAMPGLDRVVALWNPPTPYHARAVDNLQSVAPSLGIKLSAVSARTQDEIVPAFDVINRAQAQALYIVDCPPFFNQRATIVRLATQARLAVVSGERPYAEVGALMCYGPSYEDQLRRAALYVDKILKGASPGTLPVEQPTKFTLVVNRKAARTLGIAVSESILLQADEVIES